MKIGIQGDVGSTNERACKIFAQKHGWDDIEIVYLITTANVLNALQNGEIDFGTFAWASSRGGLVRETQEATRDNTYTLIDQEDMQLDHALLANGDINKEETVNIYSHPQALKEHGKYLESIFPQLELIEEIDTAIAAKNLKSNIYPENSLVIAPISCAEIYGLDIYQKDLPTNQGYLTTIYLVQK